MEKNIAVIKGDGIGPEIVTEAMKVLDKVAAKFGHKFNYEQLLMAAAPSTQTEFRSQTKPLSAARRPTRF